MLNTNCLNPQSDKKKKKEAKTTRKNNILLGKKTLFHQLISMSLSSNNMLSTSINPATYPKTA
jgi:hypothetical protein